MPIKKNRYVTEEYLDQKLIEFGRVFIDELKLELKQELKLELKQELTEELIREIKDPIFEKLDAFLKEIRDSREEQTLLAGKQSEHSDILEDHEARLKKLETCSSKY